MPCLGVSLILEALGSEAPVALLCGETKSYLSNLSFCVSPRSHIAIWFRARAKIRARSRVRFRLRVTVGLASILGLESAKVWVRATATARFRFRFRVKVGLV